MFILEGVPISPGYAQGEAVVYDVELGARLENAIEEPASRRGSSRVGASGGCFGTVANGTTPIGRRGCRSPLLKQSAGILAAACFDDHRK